MNKYIQTAIILLITQLCFGQTVDVHRFTVPLLKGKAYTSLMRLEAEIAPDGKFHYLEEIVFDFEGTPNIFDIGSVKVLCNDEESFLSEEKALSTAVFKAGGKENLSGNKMTLTGNTRLSGGTNFIWVGMCPDRNAAVGSKISIMVSKIKIDGKYFPLKNTSANVFRVASAVRQSMQDNINTSRIPGLATAKNGDIVAVFDARYDSRRDLQGDIDIGLTRSTDGGNTWLPIQRVIDMGRFGSLPEKFNGVSDPCVLVDKKSGNIFIAGLWMHGVLDEGGGWIKGLTDTSTNWNHQWRNKGSQAGFGIKQTAQFLLVKSSDNGKTWSEPVNLTKMCKKEKWWLFAPAPGSGITLNDGTLVFPTQGRDETGKPFSNITYSKDGGKTWLTSKPASDLSTTECMAVQLTDGSLMLNMRTNANRGLTGDGNGRAVAVTSDLGETWTEHSTSRKTLPEPVCMASLYNHKYIAKDGKERSILFFLNPASKTSRNQITLKVSFDDGNTWPPQKFILLDELNGSGYSCITSVDNNTIGLIYESSQAHLVFEKINLQEIIN